MTKKDNRLITCVHYVSKYLPLTQNWIYRILINHKKFSPIMLCRKRENLLLFPIGNLFSLDKLSKFRQSLEIAFFKVTHYFYFFYQLCKEHRVQILHIHFGFHGVKFIGLKRILKVPMVCSFYGDDAFALPLQPGVKKRYTSLFKYADAILVLGPYMRDALLALGCPVHKLYIQHLGIDVTTIKHQKRVVKSNSPIRFLVASSFVEKKGITLTIRALKTFKDKQQFTLDIIGDGPLRKTILEEIENSGIQDRITLHGYKPYDYFISLAYQCHVFIQASKTGSNNNKEGTPMAIVDAMATGMAVLSTKHSDIPEIVKEGVNGFLAEENSVQSLIDCLQLYFNDPSLIEVFSANARKHVEIEFDAEKQTEKLEHIYTNLLLQHSTSQSLTQAT